MDGSDGTRTRDLRRDRPVWKPELSFSKPNLVEFLGTISNSIQPVWYPKWYPTARRRTDPHDDIVQRRARDPRTERARLLRGEVAGLARAPGQAPCGSGVGRARRGRRVAP